MVQRPNIVVLMTDHTNAAALRPDSPCLTPNLDALASEGRRFNRCYTTNAICSPARASLMTGTYPSTHGMWDCTHTQRREWVNVSEHLTHWAQVLQADGYQTGYFGKWHVEQTNKLDDFGWQTYDRSGNCRLDPIPGSEVTVPTEGYKDYLLAATGDDSREPAHHPAFGSAARFIETHAGGPEPFCCFVSTTEPHDPYIPPKRMLDLYDIEHVPLSPTLRDELHGKPEVLRRMQRVWKGLTESEWRRMAASYWAVITFIDDEIGRLMQLLKEKGAYDNTIVLFTSDHGDMLGSHGLVAKGVGTSYEEVYNIPLIIRGPGVLRHGDDWETFTSLVDVGPTLLDLAGQAELPAAQGESLMDVLSEGRAAHPREDAYGEFFGQRFVYTQRIVWHGNWKYVFSPGGIDELYNLAEDPHEMVNRAEDPSCHGVLEEMCARMWRKMETIGDESLFNTHYATLRTAPVGPRRA